MINPPARAVSRSFRAAARTLSRKAPSWASRAFKFDDSWRRCAILGALMVIFRKQYQLVAGLFLGDSSKFGLPTYIHNRVLGETTMTFKVIIADDHSVLRQALCESLEGRGKYK